MRIIIGILVAIGLLVGISTSVQAQSDEGLVAEWHFDEGSGSIVKDSSGNGNDGNVYGATWVDGKFGKALSFDGVDDYVSVPDAPILRISDTVVLEFWVKRQRFGVDLVLEKGGDWTRGKTNYGVGFHTTEYNKMFYFIYNGGVRGTNGVQDYKWHHYAVVAKDGDGNPVMYIDGEVKPIEYSDGTSSINLNPSTLDLHLGAQVDNVYPCFGANIIDEVRIYNRSLTAEEIKEHYEQGPTALSLTKTASPASIKQGQTSTITVTVKNTGSTEISDIEIADIIPKDLTLIDGETTKTYASLSPKDSRQFQYSVQINEAGTFNLGQATASYADDEGNYKIVNSKPASIEVIPSLVTDSKQTPSRKSNNNAQSASVNLHGEKTDVALGENVLLKLSAVNIIGNPTMHVQVIIIPPSGWSVTSSEFAKSGAGQYSTTYDLESGGGKDIEVRIVPNQVGEDFQVEGRIIYYFGDDVATREDHTLNLPIKVRAKSNIEMTAVAPQSDKQSTPGFAFVVGVLGLVVAIQFIKRK